MISYFFPISESTSHNSLFLAKQRSIYLKNHFAAAKNERILPGPYPALQPSVVFPFIPHHLPYQHFASLDLSIIQKSGANYSPHASRGFPLFIQVTSYTGLLIILSHLLPLIHFLIQDGFFQIIIHIIFYKCFQSLEKYSTINFSKTLPIFLQHYLYKSTKVPFYIILVIFEILKLFSQWSKCNVLSKVIILLDFSIALITRISFLKFSLGLVSINFCPTTNPLVSDPFSVTAT